MERSPISRRNFLSLTAAAGAGAALAACGSSGPGGSSNGDGKAGTGDEQSAAREGHCYLPRSEAELGKANLESRACRWLPA